MRGQKADPSLDLSLAIQHALSSINSFVAIEMVPPDLGFERVATLPGIDRIPHSEEEDLLIAVYLAYGDTQGNVILDREGETDHGNCPCG